MILLWCLLGISLAFGIARYNQSNKLFWILFTSFVLGIAGASVYHKITDNQSEAESAQVCPTQEYFGSNQNCVTLESDDKVCALLPPLVSQDYTPEQSRRIVDDESIGVDTPPPQLH